MATATAPPVALPGQLLGPLEKYLPGPGTHIHNAQIYASLAGPVTTTTTSIPSHPHTPLLSITPPTTSHPGILGTASGSGPPILPTVNDVVLATITRLTPRFATAEILVISNTVCHTPFLAQIRREDIRATEKDKIKMDESFRVGDLIRAVVISLGDGGGYFLSTAENELGVVVARAAGGGVLFPVSWKEMGDQNGGREGRKVARPF